MWFWVGIVKYLKWFLKVSLKLFRVDCVLPVSAVMSLVVSQLSLILSFFLPLKVVILLGSDGMPWYFRELFSDVDRDWLVISLSFASLIFFCIFVLSQWFSSFLANKGAVKLTLFVQKLVIFESQGELAKSFYLKLCETWGAIVFVVMAAVVGFYLYPMAFATLLLIVGIMMLLPFVFDFFGVSRELMVGGFQTLVGVLSGVTFISFFGFIVTDFLAGNGVNLIYAIVSILLGRQLVQRLSAVFLNASYLTKHKVKIDSLFDTNTVLDPSVRTVYENFWGALLSQSRNIWLKEILSKVVEFQVQNIESVWFQLKGRDVAGFTVKALGESDFDASYLVKVFGPRRSTMSIHEATLLGEAWSEGLPAPKLKLVSSVANRNCLVYKALKPCDLGRVALKKAMLAVHSKAWTVVPSAEIIDQYNRSKPALPRRIGNIDIERLYMAAGSDFHADQVAKFDFVRAEVIRKLMGMPVFVLNPDVRPENIAESELGEIVSVNWFNWSIEPIAAGWPISKMAFLERNLRASAESRDGLNDLDVVDARLSAFAYAFDFLYRKQNYKGAIEILPDLLGCVKNHGSELKASSC